MYGRLRWWRKSVRTRGENKTRRMSKKREKKKMVFDDHRPRWRARPIVKFYYPPWLYVPWSYNNIASTTITHRPARGGKKPTEIVEFFFSLLTITTYCAWYNLVVAVQHEGQYLRGGLKNLHDPFLPPRFFPLFFDPSKKSLSIRNMYFIRIHVHIAHVRAYV